MKKCIDRLGSNNAVDGGTELVTNEVHSGTRGLKDPREYHQSYLTRCFFPRSPLTSMYLSEVKLEDVANVMR